jgi:UDP-N-acetylglucosamine transferase subunit ALG13
MHFQGFDRLIKKMDEIAGQIDEEVIMQIGNTSYKPRNAKHFRSLDSFQEIQVLNRDARVVVSHGGAGAFITALEQGTPVIAVPRLKRFNEHVDDHQLELVNALAKEGKITAVYDIEELENALNHSDTYSTKYTNGSGRLVKSLRRYIDKLEKENKF